MCFFVTVCGNPLKRLIVTPAFPPPPSSDLERAAHAGSPCPYAAHVWRMWRDLVSEWLVWSVIEAVCTMLIGMALWKWGIIQGQRDRGFYLRLLIEIGRAHV